MTNSGDVSAIKSVEIDWQDLIPKLLLYARGRLAKSAVSGVQPSIEPEDLVQEALIDLLNGKRAWDPSKVSLLVVACGVIRSKISHIAAANFGRGRVSLSDEDERSSIEAEPAVQARSAESDFWRLYDLRESQEFAMAFHESLASDQRLYAIVAAIIYEECLAPADIEAQTRIPATKIYNDMRTLERRLMKFLKTWKESERRGA